jgi:hypothetical protein
LASPPLVYHEYEAAKAWGYKLDEWVVESVQNRGRMIAHEMHTNLRESYAYEHASKKAKGPKSAGQSYDAMMRSMGLAK